MSGPPRKLTNSFGSWRSPISFGRAAAPVDADRGDRLAAERHQALLRALAAGAEEALAQVDVADLEADRLRGAQPAGVHRLQQRPVAQDRRLIAARSGEQELDLGVVEDLRQLLRPAWRAERGGGVVGDQLIPPQVLVERAQAGGLAVDGRGRAGRAAVAGRQVGEEVCDVGRPRLQRVEAVGGEVLPVLEEVGAVGVQGVAGEAALQLQVGEEVEDQALEAGVGTGAGGGRGRRRRPDCDCHAERFSLSWRGPWSARDCAWRRADHALRPAGPVTG